MRKGPAPSAAPTRTHPCNPAQAKSKVSDAITGVESEQVGTPGEAGRPALSLLAAAVILPHAHAPDENVEAA